MRTIDTVARLIFGASLALGLTACGPTTQDNNAENNSDPTTRRACERVDVDGEDYCVWHQQEIIIETGYDCPSDLSNRHEIERDMIVCSGSMTPPGEPIVQEIRELVPPFMENPSVNNTTPAVNNTTPAVNNTTPGENMETRMCEDVEADFIAVLDGLDTSCTVDADCVSFTALVCEFNIAPYNPCAIAANVNADRSALDTYAMESRDVCTVTSDCANCEAPLDAVCDSGACIVPTEPPARTCEDIEADFVDVLDNLDTSCTVDADCVSFTANVCGLNASGYDVCNVVANASADRSELDTLGEEFSQSCEAPVCANCQAPPEPKCDNNVCVQGMF